MKMQFKPRAYIAEVFGTFVLTLVIIASLNQNIGIVTPALAAVALGLMVYLVGAVSGAHLNPAVSIALFIYRKADLGNTFVYLFAQVFGALCAMLMAQLMLDSKVVAPQAILEWKVFVGELLGSIIFVFGIGNVVFGRVEKSISGLVVGFSLLIGIVISAIASNGILNPTVAFAIGSFNIYYLMGPVVGAIVGMGLAKLINRNQ